MTITCSPDAAAMIRAARLEACATILGNLQVLGHQSGSDGMHLSTVLLEGLYSLIAELGKIVYLPEGEKKRH